MSSPLYPPFFELLQPHLLQYPSLLLFRHADRPEITEGTPLLTTFTYLLTEKGESDAINFGKHLKSSLNDLKFQFGVSSPVKRCRQTLSRVLFGANYVEENLQVEAIDQNLETNQILAGMTLFNPGLCQNAIENHASVADVLSGRVQVGDKSFAECSQILLEYLAKLLDSRLPADDPKALGLVCTHDFIMALLLLRFFNEKNDPLPQLLEGILVQRLSDQKIRLVWREKIKDVDLPRNKE